jgi:hypothetical protein
LLKPLPMQPPFAPRINQSIADQGLQNMLPTSPKISVFPMRRGELPVGSGKFLKIGLILVGSGRV